MLALTPATHHCNRKSEPLIEAGSASASGL
jgi:hypothetical protein